MTIVNTKIAKELEILRSAKIELEKSKIELEREKVTLELEKKLLREDIETYTHEISMGLTAVIADCENFYRYSIPGNDTKLRNDVSKIINLLEILGVIVHNFSSKSWIGTYNFEKSEIRSILKQSKLIYDSLAEKKQVEIKLEISRPESFLEVSQDHLQHAINNLVHNAVKYSFGGTRDHKRYIEIVGYPDNLKENYIIKLSNYGLGILEDELEKIFERGYKGSLTLDEKRTGGGCGLPIAKEIINRHNGTIEVKSMNMHPEDKNAPYLTVFTVMLPYRQEKR